MSNDKAKVLRTGFYTTQSLGDKGCIRIDFKSLAELHQADDELRAFMVNPVEADGRRETFQKWLLGMKHPVKGYLDGTWLDRGDDREGYASEYVQGLWIAYKEFSQLVERHQGEPVCWVNDQQLLLCSKSPRVVEPDNPMMHNLPRNIAGSALQGEYCNTPLFRNADTAEVVALRGAYLRAGEREHELRTELAKLRAALKFYADRDHYSTDDGMNWDSCSGEPANILWHESETWFMEDGSIARAALERNTSDDIPDFTPGNGNKAERRATKLLAQLQADLTARDEQIDALSMDAGRYRWLRSRDLEAISQGGVFAGLTPDNLVLNEETLDQAIDAAMAKAPKEQEPCSGCGTPGYTGNCDKCVPY